MKLATVSIIFSVLVGIACQPDLSEFEALAIGDSYFAFHADTDAAIPQVAARDHGVSLANVAVSGAVLDGNGDSILNQYQSQAWRYLIMTGGGNDVNDQCECGDCSAVINNLVSQDSQSGVLVEFIEARLAEDVPVLMAGYFELRDDASFGFNRCGDEMATYYPRLEALDARLDQFTFLDLRSVVDGSDVSNFDPDLVHPSTAGAELAGQAIADALVRLGW